MIKTSKITLFKIFFLSVVASLNIFISSYAATGNPPSIPGWYLIFNDEFEGDEVDLSKWRIEDAALIKNNELQYYTPDDVYLRDGFLVLRSQKRPMGGREYTSGLVETTGKFSFIYGRVEVRARLPGTKGLWPAHWLMPDSGKWPPEIDIMELVGHRPNTVHMTNHYGTWPNNRYETRVYTGPDDFTKGFHTFAVEWEPDEIRWYVDGIQRFFTRKNIPGDPNEPFRIILNTAVGGNMPGKPDDTTVFPQYHVIDYVRVYGKEIPGTCFLVTSAENGRLKVEPKEPRYKKGTKIKITALPNIGYKFSHWSGDILVEGNPTKLIMNRHKRIMAHFIVDPDAPKLLSKGKPAEVSSVENETFSAMDVTDADTNTRWSSHFSDPQWIYIDLGKTCQIEAIRLMWEAAYGKEYKLEVSDDAINWKTVYSTAKGIGRTEEITNLNTKGRYVRLYGTKRGTEWGYSLWEFEVYGRESNKEEVK